MNILFIHGNYPAQFRNIASDLGHQGLHNIYFLTARKDPEKLPLPGVKVRQYEDVKRRPEGISSEAQAIANEQIQRGEIIQAEIIQLIRQGFRPQLILFHGGNGLGLFLRQLLPEATIIGYFEWYFNRECARRILGRENLTTLNFIGARNISSQSEMLSCDACVTPTEWQASQFPSKLKNYLTITFDGVDIDFFKPGSSDLFSNTVQLEGENDSLKIKSEEYLLTYATRGMEPLRGFPDFLKALPHLLEQLPNLKVLIGGRDRSAYGPNCSTHNGSWKEMMLDQLPSLRNHPRITYTGLMNYENYRLMLQRSNLHCYFTEPYVTSWSLFEAAACGTPILTNRSPATTGTIQIPKENTLAKISDINQPEGITKAISILHSKPKRISLLNQNYTLKSAKSNWQTLINQAIKSKQS
tara:strand:+ start:3159 stop:4397 length:1239 start_codon:yes stop_codon:yes gene_type:complete